MKVYYLRVSTLEQNTARQQEDIIEGCKVFEDKISGSIPFAERTEGRNIVNLIKQRQINTIYVHSIDRLGRNSLDILQTIQFFNEYEVNLISKKEGLQTFIDGKPNAIASLMIGILSTLSEFGGVGSTAAIRSTPRPPTRSTAPTTRRPSTKR